jgi:hypothetical protein
MKQLFDKGSLISIEIISECGKTFYAECTDYDYLLQKNVIENLRLLNDEEFKLLGIHSRHNNGNIEVLGTTKTINKWIEAWIFGENIKNPIVKVLKFMDL